MIKQIFLACWCLVTSVSAQQLVGGEVVLDPLIAKSAQEAVQKLGNEVLMSNFSYAVNRMYPRWKSRQAKRLGSEVLLLEAFNKAGTQMQEAGITLDSFVAKPALSAYRVHPKIKEGRDEILSADDVVYELLVFVPTQTKISFLLENQPKRSFMRESFQIALSKEGENNWTFLDGATISVNDLRSLFPLLPHNLVLPEKLDTEIK